MTNINYKDKYVGCLVGGAAGDALGYPVEFLSDLSIVSAYGNRGITEFNLNNGVALFSDDTQMTLFTACGLLNAEAHYNGTFNKDGYLKHIADSYSDWLKTQCSCEITQSNTWLANIKGLHNSREPGQTCIDAISKFQNNIFGSIEKPINNSKGCGGLMRVAPIALWGTTKGLSCEEIALMAAKAAALTHGHELGYVPAAAFTHIISTLITHQGSDLYSAVRASLECTEKLFTKTDETEYFIFLINRALELSSSGKNDFFCFGRLGKGWVAEETLAISVYCALKYSDNFEKAIISSVNHSGDSDSTGSVTGNILGAYLGINAIPPKFKTNLELYPLITAIAEDLCESDTSLINNFKEKYISKTFTM